jgi:hypothetical protein
VRLQHQQHAKQRLRQQQVPRIPKILTRVNLRRRQTVKMRRISALNMPSKGQGKGELLGGQ